MSKILNNLKTEYVQCRALGHQWDSFQPLRRQASWGTILSLRCVRCGMERYDTIDSLGDVSVRQYVAPDGYTIKGGAPFERKDLRIEMFRRMKAAKAASHLRAVRG